MAEHTTTPAQRHEAHRASLRETIARTGNDASITAHSNGSYVVRTEGPGGAAIRDGLMASPQWSVTSYTDHVIVVYPVAGTHADLPAALIDAIIRLTEDGHLGHMIGTHLLVAYRHDGPWAVLRDVDRHIATGHADTAAMVLLATTLADMHP